MINQDLILKDILHKGTYKTEKFLKSQLVSDSTSTEFHAEDGSILERFVSTVIGLQDYVINHANGKNVAFRQVDVSEYKMPKKWVDLLNLSKVYFNDDVSVFVSPIFQANVNVDLTKLLTPPEFNDFYSQILHNDDKTLLPTDLTEFSVTPRNLNSLPCVYDETGKLRRLKADSSIDDQVEIQLMHVQSSFPISEYLNEMIELDVKEVELSWLSR